MISTFALEARQDLEHRASPDLIAYAGLLALPGVELEQVVERELVRNPALERDDCPVCPFCGDRLARARCLVCRRGVGRQAPEASLDAIARERRSAADVMLEELRPLANGPDVPVLEHLIGSLDERGFLDGRPEEIAARLEAPRPQVDRVLALIRRHGPPGVAASDLRQCLLLQLDRHHGEAWAALARAIVADHLEQLASGHWQPIAESLGVTRAEVSSAAESIRVRLRPSGALDPPDQACAAPPALPDVVVCERPDGSGLSVELLEPRRLGIVVSSAYADAAPELLDEEARSHIQAQLGQARTFVRRLDRRWQTMRAVAEAVVERQSAFILRGPRFIAPLTRAEIAVHLRVHESTVSRATTGRYILLPSGHLVPFARFFEAAQGPCAALAQLVADERSPTPDTILAAELTNLGFPVARRTVAKYRDRLGIPPHTRRRSEVTFAADAAKRSRVRTSIA